MKSVNSRIKQALKEFTTQRKGRILVNGNYYEVYNVEYYADCYDEGKVIGNAIASQLDFDLPYMPKFDTFKYYDGVWTGSSYEYVDMGTFNVFDEKDQDEFNKHITAFDNLIKFNVPFEEIGTYPKTLYAELQNICNQAGVTLGNLSIPNGSFIIENNQYVNGESLKTVLKQICGISGNYAIMKDNTLYLQLKNTTDEVLDKYQHTPTDWKRRSYGINQVIIGDSQVEGEYVIREDAEDIELNGVHKLEVLDNLFAYTQDKRDALIDALWNQVRGFGYVPYETSGEWLNYLEIGDTITIDNVETILLRINAKSPKAVESTMSAPAIIDSAIEYVDNTNNIKNQLRRTEVKVDKQNQTIELLASEVEETQEIVEIISTPIEEQTGMPMYIENAEGGRLIDMKLYGDTYQETYSGKNLFKPFSYTGTSSTVVFTYALDGSINCNGTASSTAYSMISSQATPYLITLSAGTYTISGGISSDVRLEVINSSGTSVGNTNNNPTFTLAEQTSVFVRVRVQSGTATSNVKVYPQLEKGLPATEYEKYVGGIPSPNPEYPQIVQTVTGKQEVEVVGENIFVPTLTADGTNISHPNNTPTLNADEYSLVASGTDMRIGEVANQGVVYSGSRGTLYEVADADTIYLYCTNSTFDKNFITFYDENKVSLGYNSINNSKTNGKKVVENAKYFTIRFGYGSAVSGTTYTTKVMVSRHKITDYVPYTINKYELNLGKNLFGLVDGSYYANEVTAVVSNGEITLNGTANANAFIQIPISNTLNWRNGQTYTISAFDSVANSNVRIRVNSAGAYDTELSNVNQTNTFTHNGRDGMYTTNILIRIQNGTALNNFKFKPMLEKGSVASSYSPYKTPIELCKIGDAKDYIYKYGNDWYLHKETSKVVLDGSETGWAKSGVNYVINKNILTNGNVPSQTTNLYCNYFKVYATTSQIGTLRVGSSNLVFNYDNNGNYLNDFKIWLGTHNTEVYYQLATPTETEITDEELINQLNAIELFEGINNVSIDSGDLTAGVYMKYYLKTPLSGTYVKTEELNAKLTITTEQITSEVSAKYETKTDANGKLIEAKGYTDGQLTNYSTTTEMNSAITQKANEITSTVAETYSTKAETTTAKDEAIASANSTTDDKLSSYSTTSEMNTEIQQTASAINTRINKISTNINEETGEVEKVTTSTGYTFDENGLSIEKDGSSFTSLLDNTGTYYKDNGSVVSQTTKDGTITKDMVLYGRYYYGVDNDLDVEHFTKDDAMFIAEMYEDSNGEVGFGHFLNNLGGN